MANELKDIVNALSYYGDKGWEVIKAEREGQGRWTLTIYNTKEDEDKEEETKEATNDNN